MAGRSHRHRLPVPPARQGQQGTQITAVLAGLRGRAALAWARIDQPGYVHLARTALSPLWLTQDDGGAIWWASNPEWLREVDAFYGLGMGRAAPLHEGGYRVLRSAREEVRHAEGASFVATSRPSDERIAPYAAWRGFSDRDVAAELRIADHNVETARWQTFGVATPTTPRSTPRMRAPSSQPPGPAHRFTVVAFCRPGSGAPPC